MRSFSFLFFLETGRTQRHISPAGRDHMCVGAVKKDVLLILYVISITHVISGGGCCESR